MHDIDPILVQNESLSCIFTFEQCSHRLHGDPETSQSGLLGPLGAFINSIAVTAVKPYYVAGGSWGMSGAPSEGMSGAV